MQIYLAGGESVYYGKMLEHLAYPNMLISYHYVGVNEAILLDRAAREGSWIMDSGLFTYLFGSGKGKLKTYQDLADYAHKYVDDIHRFGWKHPIVECDAQNIIGLDDTNRLREDIFDKCGLDVMYVWHPSDGHQGLLDLCARRRYIGFSIPEIKRTLATQTCGLRPIIGQLISEARRAGATKIHLLGCTDANLLTLAADTADSTSWLAGARYGNGQVYGGGGKMSSASRYSPKFRAWASYVKDNARWRDSFVTYEAWVHATYEPQGAASILEYAVDVGVSAVSMWLMMESVNA